MRPRQTKYLAIMTVLMLSLSDKFAFKNFDLLVKIFAGTLQLRQDTLLLTSKYFPFVGVQSGMMKNKARVPQLVVCVVVRINLYYAIIL